MGFSRPKKAIGLDIGTHSVKAVLMSRYGGRLRVENATQIQLDRTMVNNDPVGAQALATREAVRTMPVGQSLVVAALAGQTVVVRYPRLTNTPKDQLENAVSREAAHNIPYDLNDVFLDWVVLDEARGEESRQLNQIKVLLVAAKHEVIDSRMQVLGAAEVQCGVLSVDSLALSDAAEACDFLRVGETVALVNIGLTAACVHFIKDGASNFIREVNWGAREMIQAIAKDRRCTYEEAVRQLEEYQYVAAPVPMAMGGDEGIPMAQEVSDMQDLPMAQELPAAPPAMGSPASLLDPLDDEAFEIPGSMPAARRPAEPGMGTDPFAAQSNVQLRALADVLAPALTRMATEFRRSFDFYEHQLYEQPVTRIILSGGVATMGLIREALQYELGVDDIESARPDTSALLLGDDSSVRDLFEQPSQFMVAIGLAARGMADISG